MSINNMLVTIVICAITGTSYAGSQLTTESPLQNDLEQLGLQNEQIEESQDKIALQQALALALIHNPGLKGYSFEIRAKEAETIQAGLYPNPELEVESENFGGEKGKQNFDGAETTIWLSQLIPLGGKISKRKKVATLEKNLSVLDYESKRLDVLTSTAKAFIDVLAAQERLDLARELRSLAQDVLKTVTARVKAGKDFPVEQINAEVALSSGTIALKKAERALEAAKKSLSLFWGDYNPKFKKADGELFKTKGIPSLNETIAKITQNPDLTRWKREIELRTAIIKHEDSKSIPDVTFSFGKRFFAEDNSDAFVMGFSVPMPVFDRNQGSRLEAKHRLSKAEKDAEAVRLHILSMVSVAYERVSSAYIEVKTLRDEVIPNANKVFNSASEWYLKGKFSYLQVLDAQRTLFQIKEQFIDALVAYHQEINDLERLIAGKTN